MMHTGQIAETILMRIAKVFHEIFDDNTIVVTRQTSPPDVDGWDSMMQVNIVVAVEREFGVRLSGKDMAFKTVGDLEDCVRARLAQV